MFLYDVSPSAEEFTKAMDVLREEIAAARPSATASEEEIAKWTHMVLKVCWSIGATYAPDSVSKVAHALLRKDVNP